ncbi:MAG: hypothetical protein PUD93_00665 [Lachnospiraceae bacterium]|nr:hypothetical protein [Lachnospiraceae bacterium]
MMDYNQFPLGIEYALAANRADRDKFMSMSDDEKKEYIERNRSAMSKQELDELVESIGEEEDDGPDLEDVSGIFKGPGIG